MNLWCPLLGYSFAILFPFLLDNGVEIFGITNTSDHWYEKVFQASFWYQRLLTIGPRPTVPHFVLPILISRDYEPAEVLDDKCSGRLFTAMLLRKISLGAPASIVVDSSYSPQGCEDAAVNELLRNEVRQVSEKIPITIGLWSLNESEIKAKSQSEFEALKRLGFFDPRWGEDQEIISEHLETTGKYQTYGLTRLNYDTRKIPIYWPTYDSEGEVAHAPQMFPTLAAAAAVATHPELAGQYPLNERSIQAKHPYTGFIQADMWHPIAALDLLCGGRKQDWRSCRGTDLTSAQLIRLRGRVALVGFHDPPDDVHDSVLGQISGAMLYANYVEALLDQRYLRPASKTIQLIISVMWLFTIELIYKRVANVGAAFLWAIAASLLWVLTVYYWATLQLGFYLVLWPPSLIAILVRLVTKISEKERKSTGLANDAAAA